jgi:2-polyprenyl-3-methyl-5-hydroxy-6-metoxy-1,4-benzoquinol methylase
MTEFWIVAARLSNRNPVPLSNQTVTRQTAWSSRYTGHRFSHSGAGHMHGRLLPHLLALAATAGQNVRVLDVGCGNGFVAGEFLRRGFRVVGIDLSRQGIEIARQTHPQGRFEVLAAGENLLEQLDESPFDIVLSTEVIEHLYSPWDYARGCFEALKPGGRFICSTPYHGYLKNFALSALNKWDTHANPLWDGGHIKFLSRRTFTRLLTETGFVNIQFRGAGRIPWLWMSMIMAGDKPLRSS